MRLNNMCNVCLISRTVEKASGVCIPRRTDIIKGTNVPVDWRHTQSTVSGSVLPFRFSFSQPNVMVCSYYFYVEHLGQNLSPATVSMLHRFRLWMTIRIGVQQNIGHFWILAKLRGYLFCFLKNVHLTVIRENVWAITCSWFALAPASVVKPKAKLSEPVRAYNNVLADRWTQRTITCCRIKAQQELLRFQRFSFFVFLLRG